MRDALCIGLPSPPALRGRGVGGLGLTTSIRRRSPGEAISGCHLFEAHPPAPEGEPAGEAVTFPVLVAAEAGHVHVEGSYRDDAFHSVAVMLRQDFHVFGRNDLRRR